MKSRKVKPLKFYVIKLDCCVPLNEAQWESLNIDQDQDRYDEIVKALYPLNTTDLEYNGHFGRNFFFSCETEAQAKRITARLSKLLV
jgi:hypothetical protein